METQARRRLAGILERLNAGESPSEVKAQAEGFLKSVSPKALSLAEQDLMEEGIDAEALRGLCTVHMEMLGDELARQGKDDLPPGHVIHTLMAEHEMILDFVEQLSRTNESIQQMTVYRPGSEEFEQLAHIAHHLVEAELHHQREEDVLFPEMERLGVSGPPQVMRMEHEILRRRKHELRKLADDVGSLDFNDFKQRLALAADFIVQTLPDHILKEDNILYPTALELLDKDEIWERLKAECDKIGYCCFSPQT